MKVLWINEKASLKGGAEQYIFNTVEQMKSFNVDSSLLYDPKIPGTVYVFNCSID